MNFLSFHLTQIRIYRVDAGENSDSYIKAALGRDSESFGKDDLLLLKKGAPDLLLPCCSSVLEPSAEIAPLTEETRSRVASLQESWAVRGQRVLLLARKIIKANGGDIPAGMTFDHALFGDTIQEVAMKGLTIVGMVGIVVKPFPFHAHGRTLRVRIFPMSLPSVGEPESDFLWSLGE